MIKLPEKELQKILQEHKLWVTSEYTEGKRANLYGANLEGANLREAGLEGANLREADLREALLENTRVFTFSLGKHSGFFHEGYVKIGCEGHSLEHWLENYIELGKKEDYTEEQVKLYGNMLELLSNYKIEGDKVES